ncbi:MAG: class A beta-lactamase-related serine hydrolase [Chloroflexi bacterium]|nr:MAG: class A beta-lactamase-related serine hydrolase [Chloroflexota bacterium]MBL1195216.1 class A beta-lactamase-related serine hydrolase [Chloroflexota bacterium]NOH12501.1 beta-lactamase family protein [Chloroflexota bacterium]
MKTYQKILVLLTLTFTLLAACESPRARSLAASSPESDTNWDAVTAAIDSSELNDLTVLVGTHDGIVFSYSKGRSTPDTVYKLASSSKWLSAAAIMQLVEQDILALDDHPQDHIPWWTDAPNDPRSQITLQHLLSFTSGFTGRVFTVNCAGDPDVTLEECAKVMYEAQFEYAPGETYYYSNAHLHIAAVMAEYATDQPFATIFDEQLAQPLDLQDTALLHPSVQNPRPAGGGEGTANEYATFLQALLDQELLAASFDLMAKDYVGSETDIIYSPLTNQGYEWHYGFGQWRECLSATWQPQCDEEIIVSSAGAFGFYPYLNVNKGYYVVIARQEPFGLFTNASGRSVEFGLTLRPLIESALGLD